MSEYGIKIKNYEAASIYEFKYGFRSNLDATDAMLTNSLFKDFLVENGLNVWKEESTRDIICVQFGYGTKDYETSIKKIDEVLARDDCDEEKAKYINSIRENIEKNKEYCVKISKQDLRTKFYKEGLDITYTKYSKFGNIMEQDTIHYKMLYRTPGKAKKGSVMFIREELYDAAHNFLYMGVTLPEKNSPIIEMGAYSSLITSTIVGKVRIEPQQILVLNDVKAFFKTKVTTVDVGDDGHCFAKDIDDYEVSNEIFDGQALIDSSIFPEWGDGYILLRHHMTKMAAFSTNIELFMRDYYGDTYDYAVVQDMWGRDVAVSDIKLITTNNAIKWLKFGIEFDYWADWVRANDCQFGIVKTAHPSKLGDVQRMSYQMVNALDINTIENVTQTSINYINKLKSDDNCFLEYLRNNSNFSNDYEVLLALVEHNPDFIKSTYFRDRKKKIIEAYVLNFKSGKCLQNADNLTIVGSPYAMLMHAVGLNPFDDPTFKQEEGCMQAYTSRFRDGEYLAEFRSPFNSRNSLGYLHNTYHEYFDKYFNLGKLCIAVNMIGTDFQDLNNGLTNWVG